jgi:hypothetical protein
MNEEQATALCSEVSAKATDILIDRLKEWGGEKLDPSQVTDIISGCLANQILTIGIRFTPFDTFQTRQETLISVSATVIDKLIDTITTYLNNPEKYLIATSEDGDVVSWGELEGDDE